MHYLDPALDDLTVEAYTSNAASQSLVQYIRNPASSAIGSGNDRTNVERISQRAVSDDAIHAAAALNTVGVDSTNFETAAIQQFNQQTDTTPVNNGVSQTAVAFQQQAALLRGTRYETDMIDQQWLRAAGLNPSAALQLARRAIRSTRPRPFAAWTRSGRRTCEPPDEPPREPRLLLPGRGRPADGRLDRPPGRRPLVRAALPQPDARKRAPRASYRTSASRPTRASRCTRSGTRSGSTTCPCRATTR